MRRPRHTAAMRKFVLLFAALGLALPAAAAAMPFHLHAHLKGTAEVPGPGDTDGRGNAELRLNASKGKVSYEIKTRKIDGASAAHIHAGKRGVVGDVVVARFAGNGGSELQGCATGVAKATIRRIKRRPSRFYVNVHNADFPNGAVRGQLFAKSR